MKPHMITTQRLWMHPLGINDADALHTLWIQPGVRQYLWDDEILPYAQTLEILTENERLFAEHQFGLWGLFKNEQDVLIGFCGYWLFFEPPELQLLYGLTPSVWGRGYATEAARAMIAHGFNTLGFDTIIGCADAPHTASHRVMERAGMTFDKRITRDGLDSIYYRIERQQD